jgi:rhamnosyltransferase
MNPEDASRIQISVVVRAHNDAAFIRDTLSMLTEQTVADRMEILFFDDNSTDGTLEIAKTFPSVTIVPWDGLPYNPPRVLNRALDTARGEFVVFNNSDAIPQSRDAVERLVAPLRDPSVGAVYGNQLPRPDAFPLVRKDNERAFGDGTVAATWEFMFSLVFSGVRADTARQFRFDSKFQYSEDIEWAHRIRASGLRIVYVPEAAVEHSHNYPPDALRKRFFNEGVANGIMSGRRPSFLHAMLSLAAETLRDLRYLAARHELSCLCDALRYRRIQRLSSYRGERFAWQWTRAHAGDAAQSWPRP